VGWRLLGFGDGSLHLGQGFLVDEVDFIHVVEQAYLFLQEVTHGGAKDHFTVAELLWVSVVGYDVVA